MAASTPLSITRLFAEFSRSEQASGVLLLLCTALSLTVANSELASLYQVFWNTGLPFSPGPLHLPHSIEHWINDGLMAVFFLLVGLEIEREIYVGELASPRQARLPILAAIGGMLVPALIHFIFNHGTPTQSGMGIPMATDIAFALGVLTLAGKSVPVSLKVFLTALAIIDDLGAIIILALFYSSDLALSNLAIALTIFTGLVGMNRLGINRLWAYLVPGLVMWYFMLNSGVHATITGVLLAFAIPFRDGGEKSPSYRLQHQLHLPVALIVMPLFALANTNILIAADWLVSLQTSNSIGILAGLCLGKPIGIVGACLLATSFGWASLPSGASIRQIIGVGCLGGIGFTMSIFITLQAFDDPQTIQSAKLAILVASLVAGCIGYVIVRQRSSSLIREPENGNAGHHEP